VLQLEILHVYLYYL